MELNISVKLYFLLQDTSSPTLGVSKPAATFLSQSTFPPTGESPLLLKGKDFYFKKSAVFEISV